MWFLPTLVTVFFALPVLANNFNCTQCTSSIGWPDCTQNSVIQNCSANAGSFQACFRAELTILKPTNRANSSFIQGCTTKQTLCTDWDTTNVTVRQCALCPEGNPQEPCSARLPQLNALDLGDGEQVEINVMVTKHGSKGDGPTVAASRQIVAKAPNVQPIVFLFPNESERAPAETRRLLGPPKVMDFENLPGAVEIFPFGWNETVTGGAERVWFDVSLTLVMALIAIAVANHCWR